MYDLVRLGISCNQKCIFCFNGVDYIKNYRNLTTGEVSSINFIL